MLYNKEDINFDEWDAFVLKKGGTIFSTTAYLEACSENWMVFWDKKEQFGIALPYTEKFGVRTLYQPFFSRYQEFLGKTEDLNALFNILKLNFKRSLISIRDANVSEDKKAFVHQVIDPRNRVVSTNAKRQLKKFHKAQKYALRLQTNSNELLTLIQSELSRKLSVFSGTEFEIFKQLITNLERKGYLKWKAICHENNLVGGAFYMQFGDRIIYLKGACKQRVKKEGGMYFLINALIEEALEQDKLFDFGGSKVENVRIFNKKLGGVDKKYLPIHWDNSPIWFKLAQRIKKWIKK